MDLKEALKKRKEIERKNRIAEKNELKKQKKLEKNKRYEQELKAIIDKYSDEKYIKNRYIKLKSETEEEYNKRVQKRIKINKQAEIYKLVKSQKPFAKVLKVIKKATIPLYVALGFATFYDGSIRLLGSIFYHQNPVYVNNDDYTPNISVKPGYYNEHPIKVCIDESFNDYYKWAIELGIDRLDEIATGIKFEKYVGKASRYNKDADMNIIKEMHGDDEESKKDTKLGYTFAPYEDKGVTNEVYIYEDRMGYKGVSAVVMHEMMHALGIQHSDDVNSIMFPYSTSMFPNLQDIKNVNTIFPAKMTDAYKEKLAKVGKKESDILGNLQNINKDEICDSAFENCCEQDKTFAHTENNRNSIMQMVKNSIIAFAGLILAKKLIIKKDKLIVNNELFEKDEKSKKDDDLEL